MLLKWDASGRNSKCIFFLKLNGYHHSARRSVWSAVDEKYDSREPFVFFPIKKLWELWGVGGDLAASGGGGSPQASWTKVKKTAFWDLRLQFLLVMIQNVFPWLSSFLLRIWYLRTVPGSVGLLPFKFPPAHSFPSTKACLQPETRTRIWSRISCLTSVPCPVYRSLSNNPPPKKVVK